jgi:hypothetical protein
VLSPVAGTDGGLSGSKRYPFVGDGGVEAATEVYVYVERRAHGSRRGLIRWTHYNDSLVGQVETALVPLP